MKRKPYPSDLSDTEWEIIEPLLPKPLPRGPKANVDLREVVNGILYLLREGCRWRAIPHDLPPWQTVSSYFRKWQRCSAAKGGFHGAYKVRTQVPHTEPKPLAIASRQRKGIWSQINETLRKKVRIAAGRNPESTAGSGATQGRVPRPLESAP